LQALAKVGIFQRKLLSYGTFIHPKTGFAIFAFVAGMLLKP
jgi:hypothetical protein